MGWLRAAMPATETRDAWSSFRVVPVAAAGREPRLLRPKTRPLQILQRSHSRGFASRSLTKVPQAPAPSPTSSSTPHRLRGPWTTVPDTAPTEHWETASSANITDGEATSDIASGLTNANTTFVAGELRDTLSATAGITLATTEFTELEFSIRATNAATAGGTYYFRLTDAGSSANFTYPVYGEVTLGGGASVQSGTDTMGSTETTLNVPITAVNLTRAVLFFNLREQSNSPEVALVRGQLTSSTNIQFNRAAQWIDGYDSVVRGGVRERRLRPARPGSRPQRLTQLRHQLGRSHQKLRAHVVRIGRLYHLQSGRLLPVRA